MTKAGRSRTTRHDAAHCHTCVTAVLSGEASVRDPPLETPGDDELLNGSAPPTADLVIDL